MSAKHVGEQPICLLHAAKAVHAIWMMGTLIVKEGGERNELYIELKMFLLHQ